MNVCFNDLNIIQGCCYEGNTCVPCEVAVLRITFDMITCLQISKDHLHLV